MSTTTLLPLAGSSAHFENAGSTFTAVGGTAIGCVSAINDGEYVDWTITPGAKNSNFSLQFDKTNLPVGATINSIILTIVHRTSDPAANVIGAGAAVLYYDVQSANFNVDGLGGVTNDFDAPHNTVGAGLGAAFETWHSTFPSNNPLTGVPWVRDDFDNIWLGTGFVNSGAATYDIDYLALTVDYTDSTPQLCYYNPLTNHFRRSASNPGTPWVQITCPNPANVEFTITPIFGSIDGGD